MNPITASKKLADMASVLIRHPQELPYASRWLRSLLPGHSPLYDEVPWITFRAIDWLDTYLKPNMRVFEYGAGGSTLFLAKHVQHVVSVEHDEGFYELVKEILAKRGITNCELLLHKPEPCETSSLGFASYQTKYKGLCFESYVKAIDNCPNQSLDLVVIDGRARMACFERALSKVKPGGAIMLDNSDRPSYAQAANLMGEVSQLDLAGITPWNLQVSQTSVWQIPLQQNLT